MNIKEQKSEPAVAQAPAISSSASEGWQRFLSCVIEHGFEVGRRSPEDFLRHFGAAEIMAGLAEKPALRAEILHTTTGLKRRIAQEKTAVSAGEDLQIALDQGETDEATILALFAPDDRARFLDRKQVWAYITENAFWDVASDQGELHEQSKAHLAYILDRARADGLLTDRELVEGLTVEHIAQCLPRELLSAIVQRALKEGDNSKPFSERDLMSLVPASALVDHVALSLIWSAVVLPRIALGAGFVSHGSAKDRDGSASAEVKTGKRRVRARRRAPAPVPASGPAPGPVAKAAPGIARRPSSPQALEEVQVTELMVDDFDGDTAEFAMLAGAASGSQTGTPPAQRRTRGAVKKGATRSPSVPTKLELSVT